MLRGGAAAPVARNSPFHRSLPAVGHAEAISTEGVPGRDTCTSSSSIVLAVAVGLALAQLALLVTTVYLHRSLSHRALRLSPGVQAAVPGDHLAHDRHEAA